jgi:hypothetical protein
MNPFDISYMLESCWVQEDKIRCVQIDRERSGLFDLLKVKPQLKKQEIRIASQGTARRDNLGILDSLERQASIKAYRQMESFNQLGIKDYLSSESSEKGSSMHTRLNHSVGVALIGTLYFKALAPFIEHTIFRHMNIEKTEKLLPS